MNLIISINKLGELSLIGYFFKLLYRVLWAGMCAKIYLARY